MPCPIDLFLVFLIYCAFYSGPWIKSVAYQKNEKEDKKKIKKKKFVLWRLIILHGCAANGHWQFPSFIVLEIKYSTIDNFACDNICMATAWQDCSCYQCDYISQSVCCRANNFGTKTRQIHQDWYDFCNLFSYWDPYIF
jgi:hypothetical protein